MELELEMELELAMVPRVIRESTASMASEASVASAVSAASEESMEFKASRALIVRERLLTMNYSLRPLPLRSISLRWAQE